MFIIFTIISMLQIIFIDSNIKRNIVLKIIGFYIGCLFGLEFFVFILPPFATIIYISQILKYIFPNTRYLISSFISSGIISGFICIIYGIGVRNE